MIEYLKLATTAAGFSAFGAALMYAWQARSLDKLASALRNEVAHERGVAAAAAAKHHDVERQFEALVNDYERALGRAVELWSQMGFVTPDALLRLPVVQRAIAKLRAEPPPFRIFERKVEGVEVINLIGPHASGKSKFIREALQRDLDAGMNAVAVPGLGAGSLNIANIKESGVTRCYVESIDGPVAIIPSYDTRNTVAEFPRKRPGIKRSKRT